MSANITVSRLYSPPLTLSDRSNWLEFIAAAAAEASKLPQWPQKRLSGRLTWPQALQVSCSEAPHASQKALVVRLSALQLGHCIGRTLDRTGAGAPYDTTVSTCISSSCATCPPSGWKDCDRSNDRAQSVNPL
jgi:hypothetical protein